MGREGCINLCLAGVSVVPPLGKDSAAPGAYDCPSLPRVQGATVSGGYDLRRGGKGRGGKVEGSRNISARREVK